MCVCMYVCMYVCVCACECVYESCILTARKSIRCMYVHTYVCTCVCMYVGYICRLCMCVCMNCASQQLQEKIFVQTFITHLHGLEEYGWHSNPLWRIYSQAWTTSESCFDPFSPQSIDHL